MRVHKTGRKYAFLLAIVIVLTAFAIQAGAKDAASGQGAGAKDGVAPIGQFVFDKPVYEGKSPNGRPMFALSWEEYPGAGSYEIAFYAEGEDSFGRGPFAIRSTKGIYGGNKTAKVIFLQGVYTDTVTYRIKVRASTGVDAWTDKKDYVWSNMWEVRFVEGDYTITETDKDFDVELAEKEAQEKAAKSEEAKKAATAKSEPAQKEALSHALPEPLLTFLALEDGLETPFDPETIARVRVTVVQGVAGGSSQTVYNPEVIRQFQDAVKGITVTSVTEIEDTGYDTTDSDFGTYYTAMDAEGETVFSFWVEDSQMPKGRSTYTFSGLEELNSIEGMVSLDNIGDWQDRYRAGKSEYEDRLENLEGMPLLDAAYSTHLMKEEGLDNVVHVGAYMDWNKEFNSGSKGLNTSDPEEIKAIMEALSGMTLGESVSSPDGEMWHLNFSYRSQQVSLDGATWLQFYGDRVRIGDDYYEVKGIENLYNASDNPFLVYMRKYSKARTIKPVY